MLNPSLDLSNPCNLNCPYCFIEEKNSSRKTRKPNELSCAELIAVVEDFARAGAKTVNIVGAGEPTIDPAFQQIVSTIHMAGMIPVVFTNGIQIANDHTLATFLYASNATVVLKYNALDHHIQDLVAGRKGYPEKRNRALEALLDHGFNAHSPTRLALDVMAFKGNLADIPEIHRKCRRANLFPIIGDFIPTGRTESGHFVGFASVTTLEDSERTLVAQCLDPLSPTERADLFSTLLRIDENEFEITRSLPESAAYYGGGSCTQILGVYVDIQGNIWPCVARSQVEKIASVSTPLANWRKGPLPSELWKTHPYLAWIRSSYSGGCPYKPALACTAEKMLVQISTV